MRRITENPQTDRKCNERCTSCGASFTNASTWVHHSYNGNLPNPGADGTGGRERQGRRARRPRRIGGQLDLFRQNDDGRELYSTGRAPCRVRVSVRPERLIVVPRDIHAGEEDGTLPAGTGGSRHRRRRREYRRSPLRSREAYKTVRSPRIPIPSSCGKRVARSKDEGPEVSSPSMRSGCPG